MRVALQQITPEAESAVIYIARVSSPANQDNPEYSRLLKYCITHQHWSVFEHAHMTLEIETSTAIATQILRHRSFTFQQFSQRYADASQLGFEPVELRLQAEKNRQSSAEPLEGKELTEAMTAIRMVQVRCQTVYEGLIRQGVARECARMVLPQCTTTRLYMTGNIRSWIHYLQLRCEENVQKEHREVAIEAKKIFCQNLPVTAQALGWL